MTPASPPPDVTTTCPSTLSSAPFSVADRAATALGWPEVRVRLAERCHTERGRELAVTLPFIHDRAALEQELARVAEARATRDAGAALPFGEIVDLRPALTRLAKDGGLDGEVLLQIAHTLRGGAHLCRFIAARQPQMPLLANLAGRIAPLDDVSGPILDSFDERGALLDNASAELGHLRARVRDLHERTTVRMRQLLEAPEIAKWLQDKYYTQREERYVLPVRTDSGNAVKGIVHGSSASGATLFIEPEQVVAANNELKVAQLAVVREEARIFAELSALVAEEVATIERNLEVLERLDLIDAKARLAGDLAASAPQIVDDGRAMLRQMRHPLMVLAGKTVVENDLILAPHQTMIITGPNAGGKTVTLKTVGLCALMLRAGMHIPASPDSQLSLYRRVLVEMGDDQSIEHSLSTFTAHLTHLLEDLDRAQPDVLLLLDEIGIGTDPGEGAALAQSLLEGFADKGAQVVATTHYERLKAVPVADPRFVNASVGLDLSTMSPTYQLHLGTPGSSGALSVAKRIGLPKQLADRATALLDRGGEQLAELLSAVADERARLQALQTEVAREKEAAAQAAAEHRDRLEQLKQRQAGELDKEFREALSELKRAREALVRSQALLKRPPTRERLEQVEREVSQQAESIRKHEPKRELAGRRADAGELTVGTQVLAERLGRPGTVLEAPHKGRVLLQVGPLRTYVPLGEVLIPPVGSAKASGPAASPLAAHSGTPAPKSAQSSAPPGDATRKPTFLRTAANTLDVRGQRADDAVAEADRFVDRAMRAEEPVVMVIHGHGTGALRAAIREHLTGHPGVGRLEPGGPEDGGDGVTLVWME